MINMELTRDTNSFNEAFQATALTLFQLLFDSLSNSFAVLVFLLPALNRKLTAIFRDPMFMQLTIVVVDLISHRVLHAHSDYITGHFGHEDIHIDMERVSIVR